MGSKHLTTSALVHCSYIILKNSNGLLKPTHYLINELTSPLANLNN